MKRLTPLSLLALLTFSVVALWRWVWNDPAASVAVMLEQYGVNCRVYLGPILSYKFSLVQAVSPSICGAIGPNMRRNFAVCSCVCR